MSLITFAFTACKEAFRIQDESILVPVVVSIHRFIAEPFRPRDVLDKYWDLLVILRLDGITDAKTHNRLTRTLILLLAGYQLHFCQGTFTYNDLYIVIGEMLNGTQLSLWSGQLLNNFNSFKASVRTAVHEHCPDSCQFWFRHGRMTSSIRNNNSVLQYPALFLNDHMGEQNRSRGWSKGNNGKRRDPSGTSTFRFNLNMDKPSTHLIDEIAIAYGNRLGDHNVYRTDGGAKHCYHTNTIKLSIY